MLISQYFLCFMLYGFIGWAYECVFYSLQQRRFVNSGFLNGCICPVYGIGALLILILLGGIKNTVSLFFAGIFVTGVLEYFTSWFLEEMFHKRWWDYTGWPFNINGRVCLLGALAFGTMTVLLVKGIHPMTMQIIGRIPINITHLLTILTGAAVLTDAIMTVKNIDTTSDKLRFVQRQSEIMEQRRKYIKLRINNMTEDGFANRIISGARGLYIRHTEDDDDERLGLIERIKRLIR